VQFGLNLTWLIFRRVFKLSEKGEWGDSIRVQTDAQEK
jgi:hypothetical protein